MIKNISKIFCSFLILLLVLVPVKNVFAVYYLTPVLISVNTDGTLADNYSYIGDNSVSLSNDGRYVVFTSNATNLVTGDTNASSDVFIRDTQSSTTTRVSVSTAGVEADGSSSGASISADGRYVVFTSTATNLVAGDTNSSSDVFLRDTILNTTSRVSLTNTGLESNDNSGSPTISSDGRYVVFTSDATNLVAGDTNGITDIFIRDTQLNTTTRVSVSTAGAEANAGFGEVTISSNGRYVVFYSDATNLVTGDTNSATDVFLRDTQSNTTTRVSVSTAGVQGNATSQNFSISSDGRYVAFVSYATNLVTGDTNSTGDIFVRDTVLNTTSRVSLTNDGLESNDWSDKPAISSDGRYVAFVSNATNLTSISETNVDTDIFLRDTVSNTTIKISLGPSNVQTDGYSDSTSISGDGLNFAFISAATNLVAGDINTKDDVFMVSILYVVDPTISTTSSSSVTTTTAILTGNITNTGGESNTVRGFDIGTDNTYTMADVSETGTYSTGSYSLTATGLTCNTTYHYRAYSTNTSGTGTGSDDTFTTSACPVTGGAVPVWILQSMSNNTQNSNNQSNTNTTQTNINNQQIKFQFTKNLKYRDRSTDVLELQKFLNSNGYPISKSGIGSIGNETTYFGPATRSALIKFQKDNNIKPAVGYFGVVTRGVVNGL